MKTSFENECEKHIWQEWQYRSGDFQSLKNAPRPIPPRHGIYMIRAPEPIKRVNGESNVVYIGQSGGGRRKGKQGIGPGRDSLGRLFNTRGPDEWVRDKVESLFPNREFKLQCAFIDDADPKECETALLRAYLETYFELPPANHQSVKMDE